MALIDLFRRAKAQPQALSPVSGASTFLGVIRESFAGAWQSGTVEQDTAATQLTYSAVYACVSIISGDVGKLRPKLMQYSDDGIWREVENVSPFAPVLRKPNRYQTRIKFLEQWITSKLLYGNAYILKQRDERNVVSAMYVLDPRLVTPMVGGDGSIWYRMSQDVLAQVENEVYAPASEIIHDTMITLWHPLMGVSPLTACGSSASLGNRIQSHSSKFFANMSRPSGMLTAPGEITDTTAARLKQYWEDNYSGDKLGRLAVLGDGLKYEPMTIPANDAQLIEQLRWTVEDVARAFHMPLYKLAAGPVPTYNNVEALNQQYYTDCLQILIESLELCLDEGLRLPARYGIELDLDNLLRMDTAARHDAHSKAIGGGWMSPNEARRKENLPPVDGGETPYLQQQNYSLAALARRDRAEIEAADAPPQPAEQLPPPDDDEPMGVQDEATEDDAQARAYAQVRELVNYVCEALDAERVA